MYINKNIIYRYESRIFNGKTFIFNLDTQEILLSDYIAYEALKMIENEKLSTDELIAKLTKKYNQDISEKVKSFVLKMIEKNVLITDVAV